jgi:hypothetical protein
MSTHTARSFAPRENGGGFRRKAYAAVLVGALSLFSWGCGNSGNNDFVASGTVTASPSPIIVIPTPTPSPVIPISPTPAPSVQPSTPVTILTTGVPSRITVTQPGIVIENVQFLQTNGQLVPGITNNGVDLPASPSITFQVPFASVTLVKTIRVIYKDASGRIVTAAETTNVTLTPGVPNSDAVSATNPATATLTSVAVNPASATISSPAGTASFTAIATYSVSTLSGPVTSTVNGTSVAFTSSNTSAATVNGAGLVTAVGNGATNVSAQVAPGGTAANVVSTTNATVTVSGQTAPLPSPSPAASASPAVTSNVTIAPASQTLTIGQSSTPLAVNVTANGNTTNQAANSTFSSSNTSVATVTNTGIITAVNVGTAQIGAVVNVNGQLITAVPNATVTVINTASNTLTLNPASATTVVGGRTNITGSVAGNVVPVTLTVSNASVAQVQGQTLVGLAAGTTNFTATTANNLTATGTLTVATGASLTGMVIDAGTAGFTMAEGDQRQFRALAQFTVSGGGTAQSDVTQQAVWTVTAGAAGDTGTVVSFEPATAGNFTALKGTGGTAQIGCIFMDGTRTVVTNQQTLTINKSTPTISINPVGVPLETNNSFIPASGWTRCFQARATYASSGFRRALGGGDSVSWQVLSGNSLFVGAASQATIQGSPIVAAAGEAELQSLKVNVDTAGLSAANFGTAVLNVTYGGAAAPTTAAANDNINVTNYTLVGCTGALAPGLGASDKNAIAGGQSYGRPVTVTGSFKALPSNANFSYPLYTSPTSTNSPMTAGTLSLYLLSTGSNSANGKAFFPQGGTIQGYLGTYNTISASTAQFLTLATSPVGFSQFIQTTTTTGTQGALQIRVQHATYASKNFGTSGANDGNLAGTSGTTNQPASDRDQARTATIAGVTLDVGSTFLFNSTVLGSAQAPGIPANINRDSGLNVRLVAQYATGTLAGVQEDVTNLFGTQFGVSNSASGGATAIAVDFLDNSNTFKLATGATKLASGQPTGQPGVLFVADPITGAPAIGGLTRGQVLITSNATATNGNSITVGAKYPHTGQGINGANGNADKFGTIIVNVP